MSEEGKERRKGEEKKGRSGMKMKGECKGDKVQVNNEEWVMHNTKREREIV